MPTLRRSPVAPKFVTSLVIPTGATEYVSSPDDPVFDVTDIDVRVRVGMADWTPSTLTVPISKWAASGNQRSWQLFIDTDGTLNLQNSIDGTTPGATLGTSTVATGLPDGATKWVRVTHDVNDGSSFRVYKFYLSDDGINWTQLGSTVSVLGVNVIFQSTAQINLAGTNGGGYGIGMRLYRAQIYSGIDGAIIADFDSTKVKQTGTRLPLTYTDSQGRVWTVNGTTWDWLRSA